LDKIAIGNYSKAPNYRHYIAHFSVRNKIMDIKKAIIEALRLISSKEEEAVISVAGKKGEFVGRRFFVVSIAYGKNFRRMNWKVIKKIYDIINKGELKVLDVKIYVKHKFLKSSGRRGFTWSDKYFVRLIFMEKSFDIQITHLGGLLRLAPEELGGILISNIIQSLRKIGEKPLIKKEYETY